MDTEQRITDPTHNHVSFATMIANTHPEYSRVFAVNISDPDALPDANPLEISANGIRFEMQTAWGTMQATVLIADPLVATDKVRDAMIEYICKSAANRFDRAIEEHTP